MRIATAFAVTLLVAGCTPPHKAAAADPKAAEAFMATNAKADGVTTLPSGLQYKIVQSGPTGGASPRADDHVLVNYEGKLLDGTKKNELAIEAVYVQALGRKPTRREEEKCLAYITRVGKRDEAVAWLVKQASSAKS